MAKGLSEMAKATYPSKGPAVVPSGFALTVLIHPSNAPEIAFAKALVASLMDSDTASRSHRAAPTTLTNARFIAGLALFISLETRVVTSAGMGVSHASRWFRWVGSVRTRSEIATSLVSLTINVGRAFTSVTDAASWLGSIVSIVYSVMR